MIQYYYPETLKNITNALLERFTHLQVNRYNKARTAIVKTIDVPIAFAPVEKAQQDRLEDYSAEPESLGQRYYLQVPRLALVFNGFSYAPDRATSVNEYRYFQGQDSQQLNAVFKDIQPSPWNFTYTLFIRTDSISDFSQIIENILPYFNPKLYLRVKEFSFLNIERDLSVVLNDATPDFTDELDKNSMRQINGNITFTIEGWMYKPVNSAKLVKLIRTRYFFEGEAAKDTIMDENGITHTPSDVTVIVDAPMTVNFTIIQPPRVYEKETGAIYIVANTANTSIIALTAESAVNMIIHPYTQIMDIVSLSATITTSAAPPEITLDFTYDNIDPLLRSGDFHGTMVGAVPSVWAWTGEEINKSGQNTTFNFKLLTRKSTGEFTGFGWRSVAYGNGLYVAVGNTSSNSGAATSPDGIVWTARVVPRLSWVIHDGTKFIAVGQNDATTSGCIYTSVNGIDWTLTYLAPTQDVSNNFNTIIQTGTNTYIICGERDTDPTVGGVVYRGSIWSTTTLTSITLVTTLSFGNPTRLVWDGDSSWVISRSSINKVSTSTDLINWNETTLAVSGVWNARFRNGLFILYGATGTIYTASASDLSAWTRVYTGTFTPSSVVWDGTHFLAPCGGVGYLYSTNGITWTEYAQANSQITVIRDMVYEPISDMIVAVGNGGGYNAAFIKSDVSIEVLLTAYVDDVEDPYNKTKYVLMGSLATDFLWYTIAGDEYAKANLIEFSDNISAVQFQDYSGSTPIAHEWRVFTTLVSTVANPTIDLSLFTPVVIDTTHQEWTVYHTVTFSGGVIKTATNSIIYEILPRLVADFNSTFTVDPKTMRFTDTSLYTPTSWDWDFGDGSPHSTVQNPSHTFPAEETEYSVTLTVSNYLGSDSITIATTTGSSSNVFFERPNYSPETVDNISAAMIMKRNNNKGIYNPVTETVYADYYSPEGTEWSEIFATAQPDPTTLVYDVWQSAVLSSPPDMVGNYIYMHIISEDTYYEMRFLSWTGSDMGGGFSYTRHLIN